MNRGGVGHSVLRIEDDRLVTGQGRFAGDIAGSDCLHAVFVRSCHANCRIHEVDISAALDLPGVKAIFTARDLMDAGIGDIGSLTRRVRADGDRIASAPRPVLAGSLARYAGDPIAVVIATTRYEAEDAAAAVRVVDEALASVTALEKAAAGPLVWPHIAGNRAFRLDFGNEGDVEEAFARASHVTCQDIAISRVTAAPLEPRNGIADWNAALDRYELTVGTQSPHMLRNELAMVLGVPASGLHVMSPDVGGSFGLKNAAFPELVAILWAARQCGRPVFWEASRSESFLADDHARDNLWSVEVAFDADARILGVRAYLAANLGAYLSTYGGNSPLNNLVGLLGPYAIPAASVTVSGYVTNTNPVAAYRGAGRPEASLAIERTLDTAARELGLDRVELRRRNLIPPASIPWRTPLGPVIDSGDFAGTMALALQRADWEGFPARRARAAGEGRLRGIGIANHLESAGSVARDMAELRFDAEGCAELCVGTAAQGQGHETAFRQLLGDFLGLPFDAIRIAASDTDLVHEGNGAYGSRSLTVISAALGGVRDEILARARRLAAHLLECGEHDLVFEAGAFRVAGADIRIALQDVARASHDPARLPAGFEPGLAARCTWQPSACNYPSGTHVCEVEIDPQTGEVRLLGYVALEDCGRVINPALLAGQIHGGIVQGAAQVLMEAIVHDEYGQILTGSFLDYAMPRASDMPSFVVEDDSHLATTNPMGIKGAGESGTVGALPAVLSAVLDALAVAGVHDLDMPATPSRVWRALSARALLEQNRLAVDGEGG
ncbi:MAG: xanthine dehydrogenase family protein molybdopterin-binding subunit [Beijerinckiaceae bacterium]|nr:xanthine dehydrogenase family protein molybdopterin-binding subunit [Beijerinckiaceae bacterium]